jgi:hypothetical protein
MGVATDPAEEVTDPGYDEGRILVPIPLGRYHDRRADPVLSASVLP